MLVTPKSFEFFVSFPFVFVMSKFEIKYNFELFLNYDFILLDYLFIYLLDYIFDLT